MKGQDLVLLSQWIILVQVYMSKSTVRPVDCEISAFKHFGIYNLQDQGHILRQISRLTCICFMTLKIHTECQVHILFPCFVHKT